MSRSLHPLPRVGNVFFFFDFLQLVTGSGIYLGVPTAPGSCCDVGGGAGFFL